MKYLSIATCCVLISSCAELDWCADKRDWFDHHEKRKEYKGEIVQKLYDHKDNRGEPIIILHDRTEHLLGNGSIFDAIQKGDYLIKEKDSSKYILITARTNDTTFFYWQCKGVDIKE